MSHSKTNLQVTIPAGAEMNGGPEDYSLMSIIMGIPAVMSFNLDLMRGMGMMDSHKYREKFMAIAVNQNLQWNTIFMIVAAAVAVKNKDRIMVGLEAFKTDQSIAKVIAFYKNHTEQYVPLCTSSNKKFPVVKIPESFPNIALVAFILISCDRTNNDAATEANYALVVRNLWFAQLNVDAGQKMAQMCWERDVFWGATETTGSIQKSKYTTRSGAVKLLFHQDFWDTKAGDRYPLLNLDGTEFPRDAQEYSELEIKQYIVYILEGIARA